MSTPRYIRMAIEACQPCKSSLPRSRMSTGACLRTFSSAQSANTDSTSPRYSEPSSSREDTPSAIRPPPPPPPEKNTQAVPNAPSTTTTDPAQAPPSEEEKGPRLPRNVLATYLRPLRRDAVYGIPACDLQLRSYSVRNVEFMADFAMRAAYYLNLPASGPTPLPKIIERWTMPRSNFVHKKSQENFERITLRRLIQIKDGHPDTVQVWLAFLRKHAFYGVGMKANVWQHESMDVAKAMDSTFAELEKELDGKLAHFGWNETVGPKRSVLDMLHKQGWRQMGVPMADVREGSQTREQRI